MPEAYLDGKKHSRMPSRLSWTRSPFYIPLICTGARRNPAACGTHQGNFQQRFAPPLRVGGRQVCPRMHLRLQITLSNLLDLYRRSVESGDLQCKSRSSNRRFAPPLKAGGRQVCGRDVPCRQQASSHQIGRNRLFNPLDLYRRSPESGSFLHIPQRLKTTICSPIEGWWTEGMCQRLTSSHPRAEDASNRPFQFP